MYEKNIVGVYNRQTEYPVFQHQLQGERRIDPNQYDQTAMRAFTALNGEVDQHDPLEKWREESEHEREHHADGEDSQDSRQAGQRSGSRQPGSQGRQAPAAPPRPSSAALAQAGHEVDDAIAARVRSHILPATPHRPAIHPPAPAEQVLQLLQRHLSQVTEALPDHPELIQHIDHPGSGPAAQPGTLRLHDVMRRQVVCVREDVTLEQAASVCNRRSFSGLPVLDAHQRLVGEFSVQGLMQDLFAPAALQQFAQHDASLLETQMLAMLHDPVSRHMRRELITVSPETSVRNACRLMQRQSLRRLIVTEGDRIVGLFTAQDAVRLLSATQFQAS